MQTAFALALETRQTARHKDDALMEQAILGVLENAEEGELPLFARTLALSQRVLAKVVEQCSPTLAEKLSPMPEPYYTQIASAVPELYYPLLNLLLTHRTPGRRAMDVGALARAIAAAAFGERHLWQDLGLAGREDVSSLMKTYFLPLYLHNLRNLKWKRFLFAELGKTLGDEELRPPGCGQCVHFPLCFPGSVPRGY